MCEYDSLATLQQDDVPYQKGNGAKTLALMGARLALEPELLKEVKEEFEHAE